MAHVQHSVHSDAGTSTKDQLTLSTTNLVDSEKALSSSTPSTSSPCSSFVSKEPTGPKGLTLRQWLQILSSFVVCFNAWGLLTALGGFQTYYEQTTLAHKSSSDISWVSTTTGFLLLVSGLVTGTAFDYGYIRPLMLVGTFLEVFGFMMVSIATEYYQILLAQGVCMGIGCGMLFTPSVAAAATSIEKPATRANVMAAVSLGSAVGGIIYPIMFAHLLGQVGFGWTVRIMAFVTFATFLFSYAVLFYQPVRRPNIRSPFELAALKEPAFASMLLAGVFGGLAYYIPFIYLPLFAQSNIPNFSHSTLAVYLIAIINGASIPGRLLGGLSAAKIGPLETHVVAMSCSALVLFCWIKVQTEAGLIVWSLAWGLTSSVITSIPGAYVPLLSPSMAVVGTRTGMFWASVGVGLLLGSPIGGALLGNNQADMSWWHLQVFAGLCMFLSSILAIYPAIHIRRRKNLNK